MTYWPEQMKPPVRGGGDPDEPIGETNPTRLAQKIPREPQPPQHEEGCTPPHNPCIRCWRNYL